MSEGIHPHIRPVDWGHSRGSQLHPGEVERGDMVGVVLEATVDAPEEGLSFPVGSVDVSTSWAGLGGIHRVDLDHRDAEIQSFVLDERLKLVESPTVEAPVLASPMLSRIPYLCKILHNDHIALSKAVDELTANLVENRVRPSSLLSAQPSQSSLRTLCAFALERGAKLSKMMSLPEDLSAFGFEAVGGNEEVAHPDIDSDKVASLRLSDLFIDCYMEVEVSAFVGKGGVGRLSIFKKFCLVFSDVEQLFNSLLNCSYGGTYSVGFADEPEEPSIQIHRELVELKESIPPLLVGFSYPVPSSNSEVGWKIELLSGFPVDDVVEGNRVEDPTLEGYVGDVVASVSEGFECCEQLLGLFSEMDAKFADNCLREFHRKAWMLFNYLNIHPHFLPWLKLVDFLEVS